MNEGRRGGTLSRRMCRVAAASLALLAGAPGLAPALAQQLPQLERVSVDSTGGEASGSSHSAALSADGRFVAFVSTADDLVPGNTSGIPQVYVRDRLNGTTELVSRDDAGMPGNDSSDAPSLSADGRFVCFSTFASNLVPGDGNFAFDVYVHDRELHTTERVSLGFAGDDTNESSSMAMISGDGRFVAFTSFATNLVADDSNFRPDVFVHDRLTGVTERVSIALDGSDPDGASTQPSLSHDGRFVAFTSDASNLTNEEDANFVFDVFVFDRMERTTRRVTTRFDGGVTFRPSFDPQLSADGRWVAFVSEDAALVAEPDPDFGFDVFLFGLESGERILVTPSDDRRRSSNLPAISGDGRIVAFQSDSLRILPGAGPNRNDVYTYDRESGSIARVNRTPTEEANHCSNRPAVSADGHFVAFESSANNLVAGDTGIDEDVFVGLAGFSCHADDDCVTAEPCQSGGTCDLATERCTFVHEPDGTACDDGNPCSLAAACVDGTCTQESARTCPPTSGLECRLAGECDPFAGGICVYPSAPEGTPCHVDNGGASCSAEPFCQFGFCIAPDGWEDPDGDSLCSRDDICPLASDPLQRDIDEDGGGDACDPLDAAIRISGARLRWTSGPAAADGSVRIVGELAMPPGIPPLPVDGPVLVRITDGVRADASVGFAAGECRAGPAPSVACRRGGAGGARLAVRLARGEVGLRIYRLKLRASGLDLAGPFQPPVSLEIVSDPAVAVHGIDRVGAVFDCRSTPRGLRCTGDRPNRGQR